MTVHASVEKQLMKSMKRSATGRLGREGRWLGGAWQILGCVSMALSMHMPVHADVEALDPFGTAKAVPTSPAKDMLSGRSEQDCALTPLVSPVTLLEAVEHSLCHNPKTQQALADVKAKAAQWGSAEAAYLPTLSATVRNAKDLSQAYVPSAPELNSHNHSSYRDYTLSLAWKLFDFGTRSGHLEYARQLLAAAQDAQDDALQTVFMNVVNDYYKAAAAQSGLAVALQTEADAKRSLEAAQARFKLGIAAVIDQMQAQTAYATAILDRAKAAGELKIGLGRLAIDMGQSPSLSIDVPDDLAGPQSDPTLDVAVDDLIEEVKRSSPKSRQAQAQLAAALAKETSTRGEGRPSLSLNAKMDRNNQPVVPAIGMQPLPASNRDRYIGLQLDVPLFEGLDRSYQIRGAQAATEGQAAAVFEVQEQVALDVWSSYATLQEDAENLRNTELLLDSAEKTHVAAEQRYQKGAGSIIELLNAHSALATARQRRVQSLADWHIAKLQLAASLGRLSLLALK
jgi:outer membrane protein